MLSWYYVFSLQRTGIYLVQLQLKRTKRGHFLVRHLFWVYLSPCDTASRRSAHTMRSHDSRWKAPVPPWNHAHDSGVAMEDEEPVDSPTPPWACMGYHVRPPPWPLAAWRSRALRPAPTAHVRANTCRISARGGGRGSTVRTSSSESGSTSSPRARLSHRTQVPVLLSWTWGWRVLTSTPVVDDDRIVDDNDDATTVQPRCTSSAL
jgi:hypothetical protein